MVLGTATILCLGMWVSGAESHPEYLEALRAYADTLLERGRDTYGEENTPLFAACLDRDTCTPGPTDAIEGIREHDRMATGANPMHDQNLYQVLYALSAVTGEERYGQQADAALRYFFGHCQSPGTGLMAWGEHIGWDFYTERPIDKKAGETHEFFRPWVLWDRCFQLAPDACARFAQGLWDHQIDNHETGEFSRHATWSKHGTGGDNEYPRHGGFYIATWAQAYARTEDPVFLKAIETLVDYYNGLSNPETRAIPCSSNPSRANIMWPESNLSLAIDLWDSAKLVPKPLADTMRDRARTTDKNCLSLAHGLSPGGIGFVAGADIRTLGPLKEGLWTHTQTWATSYGNATDAQIANLCYLRYEQVKLEGYRDLVEQAGRRYLVSEPSPDKVLYPGAFGDAIFLLLTCHDLTGEQAFLDRADHFAKTALTLFVTDDSPLPKASTANVQYESVTRADTLMLALLKLWARHNGKDALVAAVYCER